MTNYEKIGGKLKPDRSALVIPKLLDTFSQRELVRKLELRNFYESEIPELTEQAFRRILYALQKERCIIPLGAGIYGLSNPYLPLKKRKFVPDLSLASRELSAEVRRAFPYTRYVTWETRVLFEFMIHQPGLNQIILEIEKDAAESVFNKFIELYQGSIFLEPDKKSFERYVMNSPGSILLLHMISQAPQIKTEGAVTARLEKILIDIFSDEDRFYIFHGQELIHIFENAFSRYWINPKTLLRYAGRRRSADKLRYFLKTETRIDLSALLENVE